MEKVKFNNGKLRILQISDAQDLHWVRRTMLHMLNKACDALKPDLVIFTGDNILGNHLRDYRFSSKEKNMSKDEEYKILKTALGHILDIPEERKIPFAVIYGNHDDRNSFTKDEQGDIIRAYSMNRGFENREELCGTYRLPVYSSDGEKQMMNLWMMDTARYEREEDKCYEEITEKQVEWFKTESESQKNANGGKAFDSLMFMHIPLKECTAFAVECGEDEASVKGYNGKFYKKADGVEGQLHEPITPVNEENGFYDAVLQDGGVRAIISGHDHRNNFIGERDGIKFVATSAASFRCYGDELRGVRLFEIDENDPSVFSTKTYYYRDLCGDNIISDIRWFFDADECEKTKYMTLGAAAIGTAVLGGAAVIKKLFKK